MRKPPALFLCALLLMSGAADGEYTANCGGFCHVESPGFGPSPSLGMTFGLEAGRNAAACVK